MIFDKSERIVDRRRLSDKRAIQNGLYPLEPIPSWNTEGVRCGKTLRKQPFSLTQMERHRHDHEKGEKRKKNLYESALSMKPVGKFDSCSYLTRHRSGQVDELDEYIIFCCDKIIYYKGCALAVIIYFDFLLFNRCIRFMYLHP